MITPNPGKNCGPNQTGGPAFCPELHRRIVLDKTAAVRHPSARPEAVTVYLPLEAQTIGMQRQTNWTRINHCPFCGRNWTGRPYSDAAAAELAALQSDFARTE